LRSFRKVLRGYDPRQVDELFERIDGTLGRGRATARPVTADEVRAARFTAVMRGYDPLEVDEAMRAAEPSARNTGNARLAAASACGISRRSLGMLADY
jgi:DivIVA domain-containing protein